MVLTLYFVTLAIFASSSPSRCSSG